MPVAPVVIGDWKSAPKIVRNWAYQLSWLGIIFLPLLIVVGLFSSQRSILVVVLYAALWGVDIWLNRALKKGAQSAWVAQIILSILGLLAFPVGTAIHAYVLSQWFKPETRAWFRQ